ncbi:MAG: indolepyruvate ferredoxin oxidoreductase, partial [Bacteroidales bacterium]|nr:indolepyruvate ferredoxin oxidoreductase [Bacteroidales bacterium]
QDEQDSRYLGSFAMIPMLEPSCQQDAYDMMSYAFELSESRHVPVLMRVTTRMAHSRAVVEVSEEPCQENALNYDSQAKDWVLLPVNARRKNDILCAAQPEFEKEGSAAGWNSLILRGKELGVIASGVGWNYLMEAFGGECPHSVLKIAQYPIDRNAVAALAEHCSTIMVIEEGQPFIEEKIQGLLPQIKWTLLGKLNGGYLPRTGELTPDSVREAFRRLDAEKNNEPYAPENYTPAPEVVKPRPPALCQGCGHRSVYEALNLVLKEYDNPRVFGDIGCYTLGFLPPYRALHSCVDMGASITMAKGASDAGQFPAVAVIGDSTFTHSGMTGLLDAVNENANITVIISDNLTTAMTGGQDSAGTNKFEAICIGLGVNPDHVKVVVPLPANMEQITETIRNEINYKGVSVIIPRRECLQTLARHKKNAK